MVLAKTAYAFHSSVGLYLHNDHHKRLEVARHAISSDRLQSWASSGSSGLPIGQVEIDGIDAHTQTNSTSADEISISDLDEAQILLACRAYLSKKNKLKWKGKKVRRKEEAIFSTGYFWGDPDELVYLNDSPDPFNLHDSEADDKEEAFNIAYDLIDPTPLEEREIEYSTNPFSTSPLYPSEEHIKRSRSREHLWNNHTWKESWYEKRWEGKKVTDDHIRRKKVKRRIENLPSNIMNTPEFASLSEEEVLNATLSYQSYTEKMAEAKKQLKRDRLAQREEFRKSLAALRKEGEEMALLMKSTNATRSDAIERSTPLSFDPSPAVMIDLKAKRSNKARRAYQNRVDTKIRKQPSASTEDEVTFGQVYSTLEVESGKSIQAILRINDTLDCDGLPSIADVQAILNPSRLRGRKAVLLRILDDCFDLRGKCIPKQEGGNTELQFATTCSIQSLGDFVLMKLKETDNV